MIQRAAWAMLACLALWAAQWLPAAEAHAELVSAYPAPGARLAEAPDEIRLTFSEHIGSGSSIQLFGPQVRPVAAVRSGPDPANPELLRGFPPALTPDVYTVEWNAVSLDGHAVSGSYSFEVLAAPAPGAPAWLWLAGLLTVAIARLGGAWGLARRRRGRAGVA